MHTYSLLAPAGKYRQKVCSTTGSCENGPQLIPTAHKALPAPNLFDEEGRDIRRTNDPFLAKRTQFEPRTGNINAISRYDLRVAPQNSSLTRFPLTGLNDAIFRYEPEPHQARHDGPDFSLVGGGNRCNRFASLERGAQLIVLVGTPGKAVPER